MTIEHTRPRPDRRAPHERGWTLVAEQLAAVLAD